MIVLRGKVMEESKVLEMIKINPSILKTIENPTHEMIR